jgi:hypothetical protein
LNLAPEDPSCSNEGSVIVFGYWASPIKGM